VAFDALSVHRGFVLLQQPSGELRCEILRVRERVEHRPKAPAPVSTAILREVLQQRIALVTTDACADGRFRASDSIWQHGIRSAMCVPLWSADRIIGFMQVDSPVRVHNFDEHDLDFLIALANFAAVTVERLREQQAETACSATILPRSSSKFCRTRGRGRRCSRSSARRSPFCSRTWPASRR
jgi:adenylate cyclase